MKTVKYIRERRTDARCKLLQQIPMAPNASIDQTQHVDGADALLVRKLGLKTSASSLAAFLTSTLQCRQSMAESRTYGMCRAVMQYPATPEEFSTGTKDADGCWQPYTSSRCSENSTILTYVPVTKPTTPNRMRNTFFHRTQLNRP